MPLSDVTHATVEQVDQAISDRNALHAKRLTTLHGFYLHAKAKARKDCAADVKKLRLYRDALAAEQTGGGE